MVLRNGWFVPRDSVTPRLESEYARKVHAERKTYFGHGLVDAFGDGRLATGGSCPRQSNLLDSWHSYRHVLLTMVEYMPSPDPTFLHNRTFVG